MGDVGRAPQGGEPVTKKDGANLLGDFTTSWRVLPIAALAICIGIISAFIALALLKLIGLFTNLFFFQRWSTILVSPVGNRLGWLEILVPVIGALIVGVMARYGSERIRSHQARARKHGAGD